MFWWNELEDIFFSKTADMWEVIVNSRIYHEPLAIVNLTNSTIKFAVCRFYINTENEKKKEKKDKIL